MRYFLAHNMTVTPRNVDQIAAVVRECHDYGFGMFSFQPAAFVGDDRRWHDGYRDISADAVWAQIEAGAGTRLPFRVFQHGDERCNRTAYGFYVGDRWYPILDDERPGRPACPRRVLPVPRRGELLRDTDPACCSANSPG